MCRPIKPLRRSIRDLTAEAVRVESTTAAITYMYDMARVQWVEKATA
eukprot:COSAG01_NODE_9919_length_2302_cov_1.494780_2_plen_47_part_00